MRSLTTRFFAALVVVSAAALLLGTWWVRRTVEGQLGRRVIVEQSVEVVNGQEIVRETRRELPGVADGPGMSAPIDVALLNRRLLVALSVVIVGAALVTALVARRVLGPVHALTKAVEAMKGGTQTARVDVKGNDELAALAHAFNEMADAVAQQERLKRDLTNDIAHELRTPLTDLRCHIEALQDNVVPMSADALATLHAEVGHLQRLVDDLGDLARAEARQLSLSPESVVVADVIGHVVSQAAPRATTLGITLEIEGADSTAIAWVDRGRLQQVLSNLIDNALVHSPTGSTVRVSSRRTGDEVMVNVTDAGPGIPAEHLPHVFDRFYRVDPSRSRSTGGVGLGLAIARQFVGASGGRIAVACPPDGGTTFTVTLPVPPS